MSSSQTSRPCATCHAPTTRFDHEYGEPECDRCGARWQAALAARGEVTARIVAALKHGHGLGLDGHFLDVALDDAREAMTSR